MRPYVILNAGMTLDGKIASKSRNSEISGSEDLMRVHELRKKVDAIMVGINTVIVDNPRLTVHKIPGKKKDNPIRIVVDSKGRTPLSSRVLSGEAETIIAVSKKADKKRVTQLKKKAKVIICGKDKVDLKCLMEKLYEMSIKTILLEGGGTLNWSMLSGGLVDEVRVAIAPVIVGGEKAVTLVEGEGFNLIKEGVKLGLKRNYPLGEDFILEYEVLK
jgi:2,5-diamino-6-(ribosylamino)-4(3H)-pyrimidinone 5'-phosphate reductase